jgi:uncharacterized metal-binding protein
MNDSKLPLVFACSGCSHAGATSDQVARQLDRQRVAEMSCLAGVAAGRKPFLKKIAGREIWLIDGCPIECCRGVFDQLQVDLSADFRIKHIKLYEAGLKKNAPMPDQENFQSLVEFAAVKGAEGTEVACLTPNAPDC